MDEHYQNLIGIYDQYSISDLFALKEKFEKKQANFINLQAIRYVIANREFYDVDTVINEVN
jgi:hypothetical protein